MSGAFHEDAESRGSAPGCRCFGLKRAIETLELAPDVPIRSRRQDRIERREQLARGMAGPVAGERLGGQAGSAQEHSPIFVNEREPHDERLPVRQTAYGTNLIQHRPESLEKRLIGLAMLVQAP